MLSVCLLICLGRNKNRAIKLNQFERNDSMVGIFKRLLERLSILGYHNCTHTHLPKCTHTHTHHNFGWLTIHRVCISVWITTMEYWNDLTAWKWTGNVTIILYIALQWQFTHVIFIVLTMGAKPLLVSGFGQKYFVFFFFE